MVNWPIETTSKITDMPPHAYMKDTSLNLTYRNFKQCRKAFTKIFSLLVDIHFGIGRGYFADKYLASHNGHISIFNGDLPENIIKIKILFMSFKEANSVSVQTALIQPRLAN